MLQRKISYDSVQNTDHGLLFSDYKEHSFFIKINFSRLNNTFQARLAENKICILNPVSSDFQTPESSENTLFTLLRPMNSEHHYHVSFTNSWFSECYFVVLKTSPPKKAAKCYFLAAPNEFRLFSLVYLFLFFLGKTPLNPGIDFFFLFVRE